MSEASRVQSPRYSKIRRKGAADGIQLTTACMVCTGWRGSTLATKFLAPARYSTVAPDNTHHRESPFGKFFNILSLLINLVIACLLQERVKRKEKLKNSDNLTRETKSLLNRTDL
uniref:Uncharacterized protein n=1 Tax=Glossina pallidipes TaxID=7398 RepID=A0A1A9ZYU8_GLOPL